MNWTLIISVLISLWIIGGIIYFALKYNILRKKKKIKLTEDTIIVYNDKLEGPPL
ncbi:MAG: hypothetical protein ABGW69_02385 [Nanoarchaeota archaeon]